ncbi:restriction endonuclease subunit S [Algoriphagus aquimarinus]|uniref:restriction endonuclease subunit S n=1 Tax=Algoriphagus aquimarinus TaxID=237018 RepID=UPI0030D954D7
MNLLSEHISGWNTCEFGELVDKPKDKLDPKVQKDFLCIELENIEQELGLINGFAISKGLSSTKNRFKKSDTLFGKLRPYLKKYWYAEFDGGCSSEIWVLRAKREIINPKYLFYFVQCHRFIQATNVTSGSKMPRADWSFVSTFPFTIPSIPEQQKIAEILSTSDKAIYTTRKLIDELKLRNKGLAQQLLSGKKRLQGFKGKWRSFCISDLFQLENRHIEWNENSNYNLISIRRRYGGIFFRGSFHANEIQVKKLKEIKLGDFLISKRQVSHGAWDVVSSEFDSFLVSDEYDCLSIKDNSVLSESFWQWYCRQPKMTNYAFLDSIGVHIEKLIFHFKQFKKRQVEIPRLKEQQAITSVLEEANKELKLHQQQLDTLKEQKKGLMQKLLTGEKRVKTNN